MSVLAIYAGTTGVAAVVVTVDGSIAARGFHPVEQHAPRPSWVEQSADEIWRAAVAATRSAVSEYRGAGGPELRAIGITNQRDAVVLWDRETLGTPRPVIGGQDRRTAGVCASLRDHEGRIREITRRRLEPGLVGPTLRWLAEHEANTWALVQSGRYAIGTVESYLVARMTRGTWHVTDVANAARSLLFDLSRRCWSAEMCELFGVPRDALPEIVPSWGRVGTSEPRSFAGLELPIAGIAANLPSALVGHACLAAGQAVYGTDVFACTGPELLRDDRLLATAAWSSPDEAMTYAVQSGEPTALRPVVTALSVDASADDQHCQSLADRFGVPVERTQTTDAAAVGAAHLAGLGVGLWESTDALHELRRLDGRFEPHA